MSLPANASGEEIVRDYLARLTEAGLRYLPKGKRIAFVGQTRARIERECGRAGLSDPVRVMDVLAELGSPDDLVRRERARIDAAWAKRRADDPDAGEASAAAITVPLSPRSLTSRWRPATDPHRRAPARTRQQGQSPSAGSSQEGLAPDSAGDASGRAGRPAPASAQPRGLRPPRPRISSEEPPFRRWRPRPDAATIRTLARAGGRIARRRPVEVGAVALLGVGGFLFPFPFWLLGGLAAVASRFFDVRDKWVAMAGAPAFALLGTVMTAVIIGGRADPVLIYLHALRLDVGYLLRAGSLLSACYLGWRVRQGPRERLPPWKRH